MPLKVWSIRVCRSIHLLEDFGIFCLVFRRNLPPLNPVETSLEYRRNRLESLYLWPETESEPKSLLEDQSGNDILDSDHDFTLKALKNLDQLIELVYKYANIYFYILLILFGFFYNSMNVNLYFNYTNSL